MYLAKSVQACAVWLVTWLLMFIQIRIYEESEVCSHASLCHKTWSLPRFAEVLFWYNFVYRKTQRQPNMYVALDNCSISFTNPVAAISGLFLIYARFLCLTLFLIAHKDFKLYVKEMETEIINIQVIGII